MKKPATKNRDTIKRDQAVARWDPALCLHTSQTLFIPKMARVCRLRPPQPSTLPLNLPGHPRRAGRHTGTFRDNQKGETRDQTMCR
ncbi:hypothetical protein E2C01_102298 [Portunus trituberculatus]|uniref:Uncharacterized protein n=1 Tax=Portunus trituberculatus TaxID=210409 RepID=A0A5B7KI04_PORTR|nr:hypothetical protein [Portunus trituberculatus]